MFLFVAGSEGRRDFYDTLNLQSPTKAHCLEQTLCLFYSNPMLIRSQNQSGRMFFFASLENGNLNGSDEIVTFCSYFCTNWDDYWLSFLLWNVNALIYFLYYFSTVLSLSTLRDFMFASLVIT